MNLEGRWTMKLKEAIKKNSKVKKEFFWNIVERNKWSCKINNENYLFVIVNPLGDGKYKLTYMDANINDYDKQEKSLVRSKYNLAYHQSRLLALRLMEHFGHCEWEETLNSKDELINKLSNETSFDVSMLKRLRNVSK